MSMSEEVQLCIAVPASWTPERQAIAAEDYFHAMDLYGTLLQENPDEAFYVLQRLRCRIDNYKEPRAFVLDDLDWLRSFGFDESWMQALEDELLAETAQDLEAYLLRLNHPKYRPHNLLERESDLTLIAKCHWILGDDLAASSYLEQLAALNPDNGLVQIYRGRALKTQNLESEARVVLSQGYYALAKLLEHDEETFEISEYFRTAIEIQPHFITAFESLAEHLTEYQTMSKLPYLYTRLIEICPDKAEYYHQRGHGHRCWGDDERAVSDYTQAIRLNPELKYYHSRLSAYLNLGLSHEALADIQSILERDPQLQQNPSDLNLYLLKAELIQRVKDSRKTV